MQGMSVTQDGIVFGFGPSGLGMHAGAGGAFGDLAGARGGAGGIRGLEQLLGGLLGGLEGMGYEELLGRFGDGSADNSASQETIDGIPVVTLGEEGARGRTCVICLEDFVGGGKAKRLGCGHLFHGGCIDRWLKQSGTCPMCKVEVGGGGEGGRG
ncbi:hypothetical protein TrRE_jg12428 [Triparma retinervis]|uniref:RING-type domain-containing protein n=1 Tax=Triparma retinervis TaxID=2557542 RepID=A0A9W7L839_9STRA|nr:hypothetical protein TrRE_jg12428 [Triparma retinervis]